MSATTTRLMTVEEFRSLPEDSGPVYHELRQGEVVAVTRPRYRHYTIQRHLRSLMEPLAPPGGLVDIEFAFRPQPQHELRVAHVAFVNPERAAKIYPEDYLQGAPYLVVEILSPSNTAAELYDKEKLCLENGTKEFWIVDPDRRQIKISTPDGRTTTYSSSREIPLALLGGSQLTIDAILG